MLLSVSASADASFIASLMHTGHNSVSIQNSCDSISDWFNRLTDAAQRFQHAIGGERHHTLDVVAITETPSSDEASVTSPMRLGMLLEMKVSAPIADNLTNLPPPTA